MQIRFEEIYQLSCAIVAQSKNTITPAFKEALEEFGASYEKGFGVKSSAKQLKTALSKWKEELAQNKGKLPPQCGQLLAMLEFMPCFDHSYETKKIQEILFDKFKDHFESNYETELNFIHLTKEGLVFDFKSAKARDRCKTLLAYFNFHVSQHASGLKLSIPHQQVYKLFTLTFYVEYVFSENEELIKKVKKFYAAFGMDWKSACTSTLATVDEKSVPKLDAHFQHYFLLLDIDKQISVEFTTLGCVFFVPEAINYKHIATLLNDFQEHQLDVQRFKIRDTTWFETFHLNNPHLPQGFKDFFQENYYAESQCILIPPHCLERLLLITGFAPNHIHTVLVNAYKERKLDYHTVIIQHLASRGLSAPSKHNVNMTCHYAETEDEVLIQWSAEPKGLVKTKQDPEKHVIILLDDTSSSPPQKAWNEVPTQGDARNKLLHHKTIETCIHIIEALPDNAVITLHAYQSAYPTFDRVKKSALKPHWKETVGYILLKAIDQKNSFHKGLHSHFESKEIPLNTTVINISKDFNVKNIPFLDFIQVPYIPIIIGKAQPSELPSIEPHSHFAGYFLVDCHDKLTLGPNIVKTFAPSVGPALCGIACTSSGAVLFKQPTITFISGISYHAYSRLSKDDWQDRKSKQDMVVVLNFADATTIISPQLNPIMEQEEVAKLKTVCSQKHPRFLLDDGVNFKSATEKKESDRRPKKINEQQLKSSTASQAQKFQDINNATSKVLNTSQAAMPKQTNVEPKNQTESLQVLDRQPASQQTNIQPQAPTQKNIEPPKQQNHSSLTEAIKRLLSLSTAVQLTALLLLLGLVLSSGYGALIITGLVSLSIGLISQPVISYLDQQNWQQNIKNNPSENYMGYQLEQLIPSSLAGKLIMGLGIVVSIALLGFCVGFIMGDPICVSLLAPIFNAMHHFLLNGMLDINLSEIPPKIIEIISKTMCTLFLSTIPLVTLLFFKSVCEAVSGIISTSESTTNTKEEDLLRRQIFLLPAQQRPDDLFVQEEPSFENKQTSHAAFQSPNNGVF